MKLRTVWFSVIAASFVASLLGCGGGGSDAAPPTPADETYTAEILLGGTETGTLTIEVDGAIATGTLVTDTARGRAFPSIPTGTITLAGSFSSQRSYSMTGALAGGKTLEVTGTLPGDSLAGSYQLKVDADSVNGGLLPKAALKTSIAFEHETVSFEPGQAAGLLVEGTNLPVGEIKYRYFIAAPTAYFKDSATPPTTGQDITIDNDRVTIQTSIADSGKLKAYCQAYLEVGSVRTYLAQTFCMIELADIEFVVPNWVEEVGTNPQGAVDYHSYWWEFPVVPGAKEYQAMSLNSETGNVTLNHRLLAGDVENTPVTSTPLYFGALPHSSPPFIPVSEIITGTVRLNFTRRGNTIRVLIVVTDPGLEGPYRDRNPMMIKVYK